MKMAKRRAPYGVPHPHPLLRPGHVVRRWKNFINIFRMLHVRIKAQRGLRILRVFNEVS